MEENNNIEQHIVSKEAKIVTDEFMENAMNEFNYLKQAQPISEIEQKEYDEKYSNLSKELLELSVNSGIKPIMVGIDEEEFKKLFKKYL